METLKDIFMLEGMENFLSKPRVGNHIASNRNENFFSSSRPTQENVFFCNVKQNNIWIFLTREVCQKSSRRDDFTNFLLPFCLFFE
jgi:hypothetical protein